MANTTPSKETIRRICILQGGTECHILVDTGYDYVDVLSDIEDQNFKQCLSDLEAWCGMKFQLFNNHSEKKHINRIKQDGERILPIKAE